MQLDYQFSLVIIIYMIKRQVIFANLYRLILQVSHTGLPTSLRNYNGGFFFTNMSSARTLVDTKTLYVIQGLLQITHREYIDGLVGEGRREGQ